MNVTAYLNDVAMRLCGLLPAMTPDEQDKMIFVNDIEDVVKQKVVEAKTWYSGDSDELANLYNVNQMIEYRTEPYFWKNKRTYFWALGTVEREYKLSHSGFARDMVDTLVSLVNTPIVKVGYGDGRYQPVLEDILERNCFWATYRKKQLPMTLVCGWGGLRIDWSPKLYGNLPVINFEDALRVRFHKVGPMTVGMTFLNWYTDGKGQRYLLAETRAKDGRRGTYKIVNNCFKETGGDLALVDEIPGVARPKEWKNMPVMFATPCSFYADNLHGFEGRGIYEGKIDLLDDLDQALSQQSNTARRSTPIEVFDLDFCERDPRTKAPRMPKTFERKYVGVRGKTNSSGEKQGSLPVQITQPNLNTDLLSSYIEDIKRTIISGHLSPATMGIDVDKRAGQDTLHERNKETVFTRNHLCNEEGAVLKDIFNQALIAHEWLSTGKITVLDYNVSVEFDEFSDVSFESKADTLSKAYVNGGMSPRMYVDRLYGKSISDEAKEREVAYLEQNEKNKADMMAPSDEEGNAMEDLGI